MTRGRQANTAHVVTGRTASAGHEPYQQATPESVLADELQARADEAARRIDAQRAELEASSEHTARIEREAQAGPEADWQAETSYEMDIEL